MVGLLASDNTPLGRAVVHSEFRTVRDLFDRISGGTGPGGVKAVAPTGVEPVTIVIPADEPTQSVSIVGLRLTETRIDGADTFQASGRPDCHHQQRDAAVPAGATASHANPTAITVARR